MPTTTPVTWLADFIANLTSSGVQSSPRITQLANGNILVTWTSDDNGGVGSPAGTDAIGQLFNPLGQPVGSEFLINTGTNTGNEVISDIVGLPGGGYVAIYDAVVSPNGVSSVIQGFNAAGAPTGTFNIAAAAGFTGGDGQLVAASDTAGLWVDTLTDTVGGTSVVRGAIVDLTFVSAPVTFTIVSTVGTNTNPVAAALVNGNYVVACQTLTGGVSQITLRTLSSAGTPGAQIVVADTATNARVDRTPTITALTDGGFVVAWETVGVSNSDLQMQLYSSASTAVGGVISLPGGTAAGDDVRLPSLVALSSGGFLVIHDDNLNSGQLLARHYDASGVAQGAALVVATGVGANEVDTVLLGDGRVAVTYQRADGEIGLAILDTRDTVNNPAVYTGNQWQVGTAGNDTFTADANAETIVGHSGNDVITGADPATAQTYLLGDGNDAMIVTSAIGTDSHDGGAGTDLIDWSAIATTGNIFNLATGSATNGVFTQVMTNFENLIGTAQNDTIIGTDGNNSLNGGAGSDSINAGIGNDTLVGGLGSDTLNGGTGVDLVDYSGSVAIRVNLSFGVSQATGVGNDLLQNIENLISGSGNDILTGSSSDNSISAGDGNDTLSGGTGNDILNGGDGIDTASFVQSAAVVVNLSLSTAQVTGAGTDTLLGFENAISGSGNDTLTGNTLDNSLNASAGDDTMVGGLGDDILVAGIGNDVMDGGDGVDLADYSGLTAVTLDLSLNTAQATGYGNDTLSNFENLTTGSGSDSLTGSALANRLIAGGGNDTVLAGAGDDLLIGGLGNDILDGGIGTDTADYTGATAVVVNLALAVAQTTGVGNDTLTGIENVVSGSGNDRLTGDTADNSLTAGAGNDTLSGGAGNDVMDGGTGTDLGDFSGATSVTVNLATASAQATGLGNDTLAGIENLLSGSGNDTLLGDGGNNTLTAGSGNDTVGGGLGNDLMDGGIGTDTADFTGITAVVVNLGLAVAQTTGLGIDTLSNFENVISGSGNDRLTGSALDNSLHGGAGDDSLLGGAGNDVMDGGTDSDTVDFSGTAAIAVNLNLTTAQATGQGNDTLLNVENIVSGSGNDSLAGDGGNNSLNAGAGNDTLAGGTGNDVLDGGIGNDLADFTGTTSVTVNLALATAQATGLGSDTLLNLENLLSGSGNDTLSGSTLDNSINAGSGNDTILAGDGNDLLIGGAGNDVLNGGNGIDLADYSGNTAVTVSLALVTAQVTGLGTDTLSNIENLLAGSGADSLTGSTLANTLTAGDGNDTLSGGLGNDLLAGGNGTDTAQYVTGAAVTVSLAIAGVQATGEGDDTLSGIENLVAGAGNDRLTGDANANSLNGGGGDDTLTGGGGNDVLDGGAGNDTADYSGTASVLVNLNLTTAQVTGQGTDTLANIDNVISGSGNDRLTGDGAANSLNAGGGNDLLIGGLGDDVLDGGSGIDTADYTGVTAVTVSLGSGIAQATGYGNDTLANIENLLTGSGNDSLTGSTADNSLNAGAGNDTLIGGSGNDILDGGVGTDLADYDTLTAVTVNLALTTAQVTGVGTDTLANIENLLTGSGNDRLTGNSGNNTLTAGDGNDTISGGLGNDLMDGGIGIDTADYTGATAVVVNLALTVAQTTNYGIDTILNVENVLGGSGNDRLTGNVLDNVLIAGLGNDTLSGGAGNDLLDGGTGIDTADFAGPTSVTVSLAVVGAQTTGLGLDTLLGIENLTGGSGNDSLTGNSGNNVLVGGAGNDFLLGGAGNDVLDGGTGNDTVDFTGVAAVTVNLGLAGPQATGYGLDSFVLIENVLGGSGSDVLTGNSLANSLNGGDGSDTLAGGLGLDTLNGGAGADTFLFNTAVSPANIDTIIGYAAVDDSIHLENAAFTGMVAGGLAANAFLVTSGSSLATATTHRIIYDQSNGNLYFDLDGLGGVQSQHFATLSGAPALTFSEFTIV